MFEHARDAVLVLDRDLRITEMNRAAERLFGARSALVGSPVGEVLPGWRAPEANLGEESGSETELAGRRPDGPPERALFLRVRTVPLGDADGGGWVLQLHDLAESLQAEASLRQQKEFFEAVVSNSPVAIVTISRAFRVLSWNPAAQRLFGFTPQEALGKNILHLVATDESVKPDAERASRDVVARGRVQSVTRRVRKDGSVVDVELLALPVSVSGRPLGYIAIYHDITDLQQARKAAEAANQAKSLFLATMSHEIRTPMNAIIGMTGLMLETVLTEEQRDFVSTIRQSSEALLSLLNDVLDFSKIEAGHFEAEEHPFDVRQCVESVLDLMAVRANEKHLDLGSLVAAQVPQMLVGDGSRLRQVLLNLVGNALKFTEQGSVVVSVEATRPDAEVENLFELTFSVQDTGPGIPEEKRAGLFQPFNQLDTSVSRRFGGTGLGLAISKRLVESMGGRIWVEREAASGRGAVFSFTLTLRAAPAPAVEPIKPEPPLLQGRRALIVDDNAINRLLLRRQLQSWGVDPVEAGSSTEALSRLQTGQRFDLAIIDHQMPHPDGVALANLVRGQQDLREMPLLLVTSASQRDLPPVGVFSAVLTRPVKASQLHDAVINCFSRQVVERPPPARARGPMVPGERPGDKVPLRILVVEDNPTNQKLALLILERLGYRAALASSGHAALESVSAARPDVVLMDIQMPEMDGLETTRRMRAQLAENEQPWIIAMTANAMDSDRQQCFDAGMDDFLTKPIRVEALITALRQCEQRRPPGGGRAPQGVTASKPAAEPVEVVPQSARIPGLELGALARLWRELDGQAERLLPELIDTALDSMPSLLEQAVAALARGDADGVGRAAHTLKSNAAWFGASALAAQCREIERHADEGLLDGMVERLSRCQDELKQTQQLLERLRSSVALKSIAR